MKKVDIWEEAAKEVAKRWAEKYESASWAMTNNVDVITELMIARGIDEAVANLASTYLVDLVIKKKAEARGLEIVDSADKVFVGDKLISFDIPSDIKYYVVGLGNEYSLESCVRLEAYDFNGERVRCCDRLMTEWQYDEDSNSYEYFVKVVEPAKQKPLKRIPIK
jgi:hypothetical protein